MLKADSLPHSDMHFLTHRTQLASFVQLKCKWMYSFWNAPSVKLPFKRWQSQSGGPAVRVCCKCVECLRSYSFKISILPTGSVPLNGSSPGVMSLIRGWDSHGDRWQGSWIKSQIQHFVDEPSARRGMSQWWVRTVKKTAPAPKSQRNREF